MLISTVAQILEESDMNPFRHILVAHDLTKRADRALRRAIALAETRTPVTVVLAVAEEKEATGQRQSLELRLPHITGWNELAEKNTVVRAGTPAEVVASEAHARKAGLIVIGMHGKRGLLDLVSRGTAASIVDGAALPVLLALKGPPRPYKRLLVSADYEESASAAISASKLWFPQAKISVLHAVDMRTGRRPASAGALAELEAGRNRWLADFIRRSLTSAKAGAPVFEAEHIVRRGIPAEVIREVAAETHADLVMLGTKKPSRLRRWLMGSTTRELLADPPTDLLVVPQLSAGAGGRTGASRGSPR